MLSSPNDSLPSSVAQPLVLLVEDDPDSREMYAAGLQWAGFRVSSVGDGTTALTQAMSLSPQIVVTDLHVPGLNGLELCRRLKTTESTALIPLIAVTGAARQGDVELARAPGQEIVNRIPQRVGQAGLDQHTIEPRGARDTSTQAAERSTRLRTRTSSLAVQSRVIQCRTAALAGKPVPFPCPECGSDLAWRDTQSVASIQFDYFAPCENQCGQYYFDHQRRRFMRLR